MSRLSLLPHWSADHGLIPSLRAIEVAMAPSHLMVVGLLLAGVCLVRGQVRAAVFVGATMVLTSYATSELKSVFGRARPSWQWAEHAHHGGSFPSGHSSAAAALAGVMVVLAFAHSRGDRLRRLRAHVVAWSATLVVVVVGADRILLGRHYPSDVLAGWFLAACITLAVGALLRPRAGLSPRHGQGTVSGCSPASRSPSATVPWRSSASP